MTHIDDISYRPWSMIDFRKYQLYLEMRKQRDKFLKSLREMRYCDWLIDKKLTEAGGFGKTVYILPARGGNSRHLALAKYHESMSREVRFIRPNRDSTVTRRDVSLDLKRHASMDIDSQLARAMGECIQEQFGKHLVHKYETEFLPQIYKPDYKINVRPDAYIYDNKTYADYAMRTLLLRPYINPFVIKEGESNEDLG